MSSLFLDELQLVSLKDVEHVGYIHTRCVTHDI